jgi:carboxypeptidase Taq
MTPYKNLEQRFARLGALKQAIAVLNWDHSAMMPSGGAEARQVQIATLEGVCHELLTAAELGELIAAAESEGGLDPFERANLAEMRRDWLHATAVPGDLVEALIKASLACEMEWREARPADDFARVRPALERVLELTREVGQAKAARLGKPLYDALLD